ncbi:MAG: DNA methyltransferase [Planctomycetota bacterium]
MTGFDADESEDLIGRLLDDTTSFKSEAEADPEPTGPTVTCSGDLIQLGNHRLLCGDATSPSNVRRLMEGKRARLFATDPPYLVGYDAGNRQGSVPNGSDWDRRQGQEELYSRFISAAVAEAIAPDAAWYHWHASSSARLLEDAWETAGALRHVQIILDREFGLPGRSWYHWQHEPCLMGWLAGHRPPRVDRQRMTTIWRFPTPRGAARPDHPTPKPIEVFELPMRQHTRPATSRREGDICYEPFAGSGTQIIAAERLGRRCFAMELSPTYCDVIVRRFIALAGESAVYPDVAKRYRLSETEEASR